jgi:hypothetical protein
VPGQIELLDKWTRDTLDLLDAHFATTPFLFGGKPSLGDFGLIGPMYAHLGRDPWSKRELVDPRKHLRAWVDRMIKPQPRTGAFLPDDKIPETLVPIFRAMFREIIPMLEGIAREVRAVLPNFTDGRRLPRGIGQVEFPMGEGRYKRMALPYILWMAQRIFDMHRNMNPAEQASVREWLRQLGGESLLDLDVPPLKRLGLRVAAA